METRDLYSSHDCRSAVGGKGAAGPCPRGAPHANAHCGTHTPCLCGELRHGGAYRQSSPGTAQEEREYSLTSASVSVAVTRPVAVARLPVATRAKKRALATESQSLDSRAARCRSSAASPSVALSMRTCSLTSHAKHYIPLNVDRLQFWIDQGRIDPTQQITARELLASRCIHKVGDGVKLLADGAQHLRTPVSLVVSRASQRAIKAVEGAGGSIVCRYYNATSLLALVRPQKWLGENRPLPHFADPVSKRELLWYSSLNNRGYLALRDFAARKQNGKETRGQDATPAAQPAAQEH